MTDEQVLRVERERSARCAHLAQKGEGICAAELENDHKPAAPAVLQPRINQVLKHMMRLFDKIAEHPVKRPTRRRLVPKSIFMPVFDLWVLERAALERTVIDG